jgi:hypothetical protein
MHQLLKPSSILIAILLAACGQSEAPSQPPPVPPTYHRDIAPLVQEKCGSCHVEGGIAPFSLQRYDEVFPMRTAIQASVKLRMMPPWMPARDCSEYTHDRSLTDEQIELISRWVDEGGAEGDPAEAPAGTAPVQDGLSRVDLEVAMPEAYTPRQSPDDYRCFIIDWPETEVRYVSGFRANPGRSSIVHHVIAFLASPEEVAGYQALDDAAPGPGYSCYGGPRGEVDSRTSWLGSWVPGTRGLDYPAGTGIRVSPGSKIILQVHYNLSSAVSAEDRTSLSMSLESSVQKVAIIQPWANPAWARREMPIPAGQSDVRHRFAFDVVPVMSRLTNGLFRDNEPITLHTSGLHMHTLGKRATMEIERRTGATECMLNIPRWDFHWQGMYLLQQPKVVRAGDRIAVECHWDNSLPGAKDTNWGEGTEDEMCLGSFYLTQ